MEIPNHILDRLRTAGLLVGEPFPAGHKAFPDGVVVCKPATVKGNSIGRRGRWADSGAKIDAPAMFIHGADNKWFVTVHEYVPGPGPGDFVNSWETPDEAVSDALDYFFGDPSRMEAGRPADWDHGSIENVIATIRAILDCKMDVLNGCRELCSRLVASDLDDVFAEIQILNGLESEFDHLPVGAERQYWNPDVLKRKDEEIATLTAHYSPVVIGACHRLLAQLGQT